MIALRIGAGQRTRKPGEVFELSVENDSRGIGSTFEM